MAWDGRVVTSGGAETERSKERAGGVFSEDHSDVPFEIESP